MTYEIECQYPYGCPIAPLLEEERELSETIDRLFLAVKDMTELDEIRGQIAKANAKKEKLIRLSVKRNSLHPCLHCPYLLRRVS